MLDHEGIRSNQVSYDPDEPMVENQESDYDESDGNGNLRIPEQKEPKTDEKTIEDSAAKVEETNTPDPDEDDKKECPFLKDQKACIPIMSLKEEIKSYADILQKPVEIYLDHCKKYAASYTQTKQTVIQDYKFSRKDL